MDEGTSFYEKLMLDGQDEILKMLKEQQTQNKLLWKEMKEIKQGLKIEKEKKIFDQQNFGKKINTIVISVLEEKIKNLFEKIPSNKPSNPFQTENLYPLYSTLENIEKNILEKFLSIEKYEHNLTEELTKLKTELGFIRKEEKRGEAQRRFILNKIETPNFLPQVLKNSINEALGIDSGNTLTTILSDFFKEVNRVGIENMEKVLGVADGESLVSLLLEEISMNTDNFIQDVDTKLNEVLENNSEEMKEIFESNQEEMKEVLERNREKMEEILENNKIKLDEFELKKSEEKELKFELDISERKIYEKKEPSRTFVAYSKKDEYLIAKYGHGIKMVTKDFTNQFKLKNSK